MHHHPHSPPPRPSDRECCEWIEDRYFDSLGTLDDLLRDIHISRSRYDSMLYKAGLSPPDE